jgi:putative nucleotidyltransferase with HDIG domain
MKLMDSVIGGLKELWLAKALENRYIYRGLIAALVFVFLFAILGTNLIMERYDLKEGEISPLTIRAPRQTINTLATQKLQKEIVDSIPKVYTKDERITKEVLDNIQIAFTKIRGVRNTNLTTDEKIDLLQKELSFDLTLESYNGALRISDDTLLELENQLIEIVEPIMEEGFRQEEKESVKNSIVSKVQKLRFTMDIRTLGQDIALGNLKPNDVPDIVATERLQWEAIERISPVLIRKNAIIIEEGKEITTEHIAILKDLDLLEVSRGENLLKYLGIAILAIAVIMVVTFYIYLFNNETYRKRSHLLLLTVIFVLSMLIAHGVGVVSGYLMGVTVTGGAMLISILLHSRLAILMNIVMSILVGLLAKNEFSFAIVPMISGIFGVFAVQKATTRSDLTRAAIILSISNFFIISAFGLIELRMITSQLLMDGVMGLLSGILASIYAIGFLPFLESSFGITTSMKLLELANPNHPLLKRLMLEAPGTYHHSIIVGNLAEAAANAVQADGLLSRVGSYYHDIGKLKRPYFFIENQQYSDNPHDKCTPTLSTLIITSHVKDGLELAREHRIPQVIQDIMIQHHGTGLLTYFYKKASDSESKGKEVHESNYRYEGPKPKTKEAAIVMMADTIEAAVRSMKNPTPGKIEGLVRKLIKEKLNDEQFDECDITLKELDEMAKAFSRVLVGIFHPRIEYPDSAIKELERGDKNASPGDT